jgi:hypothetical protein
MGALRRACAQLSAWRKSQSDLTQSPHSLCAIFFFIFFSNAPMIK